MTLVAAVGCTGVIGRDGDLPWECTGDLVLFGWVIMGYPPVMGRRTYDSIGCLLPGRTTVVVAQQPDWHVDEVTTAATLEAALRVASGAEVVGGGDV